MTAATVSYYASTIEVHARGCAAASRRNAEMVDTDLDPADVAENLAEAKDLNSSDYKVHACWRGNLPR